MASNSPESGIEVVNMMKIIDFIVVVTFFIIAIYLLIKGYPETFGTAGFF